MFTIALATPRVVQVCAIEHWQSSRSVGGGIVDCFLLGWIATWSEPDPALVIAQSRRSHSTFGQSLSRWGVHTLSRRVLRH